MNKQSILLFKKLVKNTQKNLYILLIKHKKRTTSLSSLYMGWKIGSNRRPPEPQSEGFFQCNVLIFNALIACMPFKH